MVGLVDGFQELVRHLTSVQTNCIEEPFETAGEPVPWPSIINPLWVGLLLKAEVAPN